MSGTTNMTSVATRFCAGLYLIKHSEKLEFPTYKSSLNRYVYYEWEVLELGGDV